MSCDLKDRTRRDYQMVNIEYYPKLLSLSINTPINRQDIVVELSVVTNLSSFFRVAETGEDIAKIRKKLKDDASKQLDYENLVSSDDDCVVITGVPGSGKTTLMETLLHQWASNELWKDKFDFIFVIHLRKLVRFKNDHDITSQEILSYFYPNVNFDILRKAKDSKSLLILDGFDELHVKRNLTQPEEKFASYERAIYDLLDFRNKNFPFRRLITSRPGSCDILFETNLLKDTHHRVIEVTGFSETSIHAYINKHFQYDPCRVTEIMNQLKHQQFLYDMMTNPFYCWGICYLISNDVPLEEFGQTYTSLYSNLLVVFILKHGLGKECRKICDVVNNPKFKDICIGISELAYQLEISGKINFTEDDLPGGIDVQVLIADSGMIIEIEESHGFSKSYQFLHYTLHEFLVAINLFIKGEKGLRSKQVNLMLAGLYGASVGSANPKSITKKITEAVSDEIKKIDVEDILKNCYGSDIILLEECFYFIYEYRSKSFTADFQISFIQNEMNEYIRSKKYFKDLCEKGKVWIQTGILYIFFDGLLDLGVLLRCCDELYVGVGGKKCVSFIVEHLKPNKTFSRITLYTYHPRVVDLLQYTKDLKIEKTLPEDTFVSIINRLLEINEDLTTSKKIRLRVSKHSNKLRELKSRFETTEYEKDNSYIVDIKVFKYLNLNIIKTFH